MGVSPMDACTHAHRAQPDPELAAPAALGYFVRSGKIAPRLRSPLRVERASTHVHGQDAHATNRADSEPNHRRLRLPVRFGRRSVPDAPADGGLRWMNR